MKRSELRSGMTFVTRNATKKRLVLLGSSEGDTTCNEIPEYCDYGKAVRHFDYFELCNWNENLTTKNDNVIGDIIKVYDAHGTLLWKRKDNVDFFMDVKLRDDHGNVLSEIKNVKCRHFVGDDLIVTIKPFGDV